MNRTILFLALLTPSLLLAKEERHLIYLHGRIVQEQESARPKHAQHGYYEFDQIVDAFRVRGFTVDAERRTKGTTVEAAADKVVAKVRRLLDSGVPADRITIVGASMGASIAFQSSARLKNPDLRFVTVGACLSANAAHVHGLRGRMLAIWEETDTTGPRPCETWKGSAEPGLDARELRINTGLDHGFIYRPLAEWLNPAVEFATAPKSPARIIPITAMSQDVEVLYGDPEVPGQQFVMRIRELPGGVIPPHRHPVDEHITVVQGTVYFAVGETFDKAVMKELKTGSYAFIPKGSTMFGYTPEAAIVQVHGVGPFHIHWRAGKEWRDRLKTLDDPDAAKVFKFKKGETVITPRGRGTIRQGYDSGEIIGYEIDGENGTLFMALESDIRR